MLIYAFRRRLWLVAIIVAADVLIALFIGDTLIRWELEQIQEAWYGGR